MLSLKTNNEEVTMKNSVRTFYYSRKKLGLYLIFNIILLALAILFTLTIFPEYPAVYFFAIGSSLLSVISALVVFLIPLPLAVITPQSIKIDRGEPLPWSAVRSVRKVQLGKGLFHKSILRLNPGRLSGYHMTLMQRISAASDFGPFSIPLYAMNKKDAQDIERLIKGYVKPVKRSNLKPAAKAKLAVTTKTRAKTVPAAARKRSSRPATETKKKV